MMMENNIIQTEWTTGKGERVREDRDGQWSSKQRRRNDKIDYIEVKVKDYTYLDFLLDI